MKFNGTPIYILLLLSAISCGKNQSQNRNQIQNQGGIGSISSSQPRMNPRSYRGSEVELLVDAYQRRTTGAMSENNHWIRELTFRNSIITTFTHPDHMQRGYRLVSQDVAHLAGRSMGSILSQTEVDQNPNLREEIPAEIGSGVEVIENYQENPVFQERPISPVEAEAIRELENQIQNEIQRLNRNSQTGHYTNPDHLNSHVVDSSASLTDALLSNENRAPHLQIDGSFDPGAHLDYSRSQPVWSRNRQLLRNLRISDLYTGSDVRHPEGNPAFWIRLHNNLYDRDMFRRMIHAIRDQDRLVFTQSLIHLATSFTQDLRGPQMSFIHNFVYAFVTLEFPSEGLRDTYLHFILCCGQIH